MTKVVEFADLEGADLQVDALYRGGSAGNAGDDPLPRLVGTGNSGGFRTLGNPERGYSLCVLYSSMDEADWPDELDLENGRFTYFGDNRTPGHDLHAKRGNRVLEMAFRSTHAGDRSEVPPFLLFTKAGNGRDVVFRGLAVPGAPDLGPTEDLVAIWRSRDGNRFQNYRATFTVLDAPRIPRAVIGRWKIGERVPPGSPEAWERWALGGAIRPLLAPRNQAWRRRDEQLPPPGSSQARLLARLVRHFKEHPRGEYAFEPCAAELVRMLDGNVRSCDLTRPWRDGGYDARGTYHIGLPGNGIGVEFALEAKCKQADSGSGVKETSRLVSRLRHRQFGFFVTTSYVSEQAYRELVDDLHPVLVLAGADIISILAGAGISTIPSMEAWLLSNFPHSNP